MRCILLLALSIVVPACADISASTRMHATSTDAVAPDPASATVVFLRPGGGGANALFDDNGQSLGEVLTGTKVVVKVPPGPHTFVKAMFTNSAQGDFSLFKGVASLCSAVSGVLEAGKLYFVEAGLFKLFTLTPDDARLSKWMTMPNATMDPAIGPASVATDPEWRGCVENARNSEARRTDKAKTELTSGVSAWPAQ
jgi:hypothetical protein